MIDTMISSSVLILAIALLRLILKDKSVPIYGTVCGDWWSSAWPGRCLVHIFMFPLRVWLTHCGRGSA